MSGPFTLVIRQDRFLALEEERITCRASDGSVNLTELCQAGRRHLSHWNSLKRSQAFVKALVESTGIPIDRLMLYEDHGPSDRATWGHPQVAINIAQWISPEFDVKVSAWVYELASTGKVELEYPSTNMEIDQAWLTRIRELEGHVGRLESELKEERKAHNEDCKELVRVQKNHNALTKRRQYHKLKKGPCLYIWHCPEMPTRCKIGHTDDVDERLAEERTCVPDLHLDMLAYTDDAEFVERCLLKHFRNHLLEPNHELVKFNLDGASQEAVNKAARIILKRLKAEWTEDDGLWRYNNEEPPVEPEIDTPKDEVKEPTSSAPSTVVNVTQVFLGLSPSSKSLEARTCPDCGRVFSCKGGREQHQQVPGRCLRARTNTPKPDQYFCDFCEAGYTTRAGLSYHLSHSTCGSKQRDRTALIATSISVNNVDWDKDELRHTCRFCGTVYANRPNLRRHLRDGDGPCVELERKRILALETGKQFEHQLPLRVEVEQPDESKHVCEYCGNSYSSRSNLRNHVTRSETPCVKREQEKILAAQKLAQANKIKGG